MKRLVSGALALVLASSVFVADAAAFCGFYVGGADQGLYNDATQVVLMRGGETTVVSMQNAYEGPPEDFAMVVPVPQILQKENVKTLPKEVFDKVDRLSAPRLVEYWEQDPCAPDYDNEALREGAVPVKSLKRLGRGPNYKDQVKVEAQFEVGEHDIVILSAKEATALETWLKANTYVIPDGAAPFFRPYVESGSYFFVAKVDVKKATYKDGRAVLSPLRFHYTESKFQLPIRLGLINSRGQQDLLVYILAQGQRYDVANYPKATIPTNLEVANSVRENFGGFDEALFSRTIEETPGAVVTEYSWPANGCDPCPAGVESALNQQDFKTLGADVILGSENASNWMLTRLHARYDKGIDDDLVFEAVTAIEGGREYGPDDNRQGAQPTMGTMSFFQGRYIIRHEWAGEVACENPIRGRWGGPPEGGEQRVSPAASRNTTGQAPKPVDLASQIKSTEVVGLKGLAGVAPEEAGARPKPDTTAEKPTPVDEPRSKGCAAAHSGSSPTSAFLALFMLGLTRIRRR